MKMYTYYLSGLDCANCALKIENKLKTLDFIESLSLNFSTLQLKFILKDGDSQAYLNQIFETVARLEPDIVMQSVAEATTAACEKDGCQVNVEETGQNHKPKPLFSIRSGNTGIFFQIGLGIFFLLLAQLPFPPVISLILYASSVIVAGYPIFKSGLKKLIRFSIDENLLMMIAVIAAFGIGEYFEAVIVVLLFAIGEYLEDLAVSRSRKSIEALTNIRPEKATVIFPYGSQRQVMCEDIPIGSILLIKAGERIPLDCRIIEGATTIDNAAITGESLPVGAIVGDTLLSGGINLTTVIKAEVTKTFSESAASRILTLVQDSVAQKGKTEKFISRFAAVYTPIIMVCSLLVVIIPTLLGFGEWQTWFKSALVFLVAACPCALVISVPLSFFAGIGAASKHGVLVKGGKFLEICAKAKAIVFDKTGTLTTGELKVEKIISFGDLSSQQILTLAAMCEQYSTHPIAKSVLAVAGTDTFEEPDEYTEYAGMGVSVVYRSSHYICGSARMLSQQGIKTEHIPFANLYLARDGIILGGILISDEVRDDSIKAVSSLNKLGISHIYVVSGDNEAAVQACAQKVGADGYYANCMPEDKRRVIGELSKKFGSTLFVGDGINDAPVLAAADAGIAMGLGSDAAIQAADLVLMAGTPAPLPKAIELSRRSMRIIRFNIIFALVVKLIVLILGVLGMAQMWMAVIADVGVSIIAVFNATRILWIKHSAD